MSQLSPSTIEAQRDVVNAVARLAVRHEVVAGPTDTRTVWHEWGEGPVLVLLHGGFGSWRHWIRNVEALSQNYRVLCVDTPGLGESEAPPEPVDPPLLGAIVADALNKLAPDGNLHMAAFSFGGVVGGQAALGLTDRLRTFTLCGASGMGLKREKRMLVRREAEMTADERREANIENLKRLMLHNHDVIDPLGAFIHIENDNMARLRSRRMSMGDSLAHALGTLGERGVQLNGIWGEHDITATPWIKDRQSMLRSCCADSMFAEIKDAGHWVSFEACEKFNHTLKEFLTK